MSTVAKTRFAYQLKSLRLRHNWTQAYIAEQIGTTTVNISRWERSQLLPGLYFRQRLCELFDTNSEELGLLVPEAAPPAAQPLVTDEKEKQGEETTSAHITPALSWHVPYARNPLFTNRANILKKLEETFFSNQNPHPCQVQALCGIGGIGKTQIALEYAYLHQQRYSAVFWLHAESHATLLTSIRSLLAGDPDIQDETDIVRAFITLFKRYSGWLLILDNLTDFSILEKAVALNPTGHLLLTTTSQILGTLANPLYLDKMTVEESALFLLRRARLISLHHTISDAHDTLVQQASEIARLMDGLPLALDQVGAYIEEVGCSLQDYFSLYKQLGPRLLERRGRFVTGHPNSVTATILHAYTKVKQTDPLAADLLHVCTLLGSATIPESLLLRGAQHLGPNIQRLARDKTLLHEAISTLRTYSLVTHPASLQSISVHPLVQEVLRWFLDAETRSLWVERVVRCINATLPDAASVDVHLFGGILPHIESFVRLSQYLSIGSQVAGVGQNDGGLAD